MAAPPIHIFEPDSSAPELSAERFKLDKFLGGWHVVWSTLPLWKDKKGIFYSMNQCKLPANSIRGIDTVDTVNNGATFNWRGKGWLKIASSHWQFLGFDQESPEPQWAVTYFSKTLFTPAGLDIYMRRPVAEAGDAGRTQMESIVEAIIESPDKTVAQMASEVGFVVGRP